MRDSVLNREIESGAVSASLAPGNDFLNHGDCLHCTSESGETEIWVNRDLKPRRKMMKESEQARFRRLPVVSHGAEHLVIGWLMRRNILACKAPPNNEGYDIICIQPDPKKVTKQIRVQVKSRYQTDCDRAFPVKERTFKAFDCLVVVFPNIGYFYGNTQRHTRTTILAEIGGRAPHLQQRAGDYAPASPRGSD